MGQVLGAISSQNRGNLNEVDVGFGLGKYPRSLPCTGGGLGAMVFSIIDFELVATFLREAGWHNSQFPEVLTHVSVYKELANYEPLA